VIELDVEKQLGLFSLALKVETTARAIALTGPSGSGKTALLDMIAGLIAPDRGRILYDGHLLFDATGNVNVPPHRRRVGYVFQEARLFPHLTVARNLDYGRRAGRLERDANVWDRIVAMLELRYLLGRRPAALSGGERQRVAIARALMMRPQLLLMDQPFAAVEAARQAELMPYLERLRDEAKVPIILASHHGGELRRIATHVVRIASGRVVAAGGPELLAGDKVPDS